MSELKRNIACDLCVKAYKLKEEFLGKGGGICYWCQSTIRNTKLSRTGDKNV